MSQSVHAVTGVHAGEDPIGKERRNSLTNDRRNSLTGGGAERKRRGSAAVGNNLVAGRRQSLAQAAGDVNAGRRQSLSQAAQAGNGRRLSRSVSSTGARQSILMTDPGYAAGSNNGSMSARGPLSARGDRRESFVDNVVASSNMGGGGDDRGDGGSGDGRRGTLRVLARPSAKDLLEDKHDFDEHELIQSIFHVFFETVDADHSQSIDSKELQSCLELLNMVSRARGAAWPATATTTTPPLLVHHHTPPPPPLRHHFPTYPPTHAPAQPLNRSTAPCPPPPPPSQPSTPADCKRIMSLYDLDESGQFETDEFCTWLSNELLKKKAPPRGTLKDENGDDFEIPEDGQLIIDFEAEPLPPGAESVADDAGIESLVHNISSAATDAERQALLDKAISNSDIYLTAQQAQLVCERCTQVSGWGVYCYDFPLLPRTSCCSCSSACRLPLVSQCLQPVEFCSPTATARASTWWTLWSSSFRRLGTRARGARWPRCS